MAPIVASMVKKNEKLVTMRFSNVSGGMPPVLFAYGLGHWEIARFLYSRTPIQVLTEDNNGRDGAELISQCIFYINKFGNAGSITPTSTDFAMQLRINIVFTVNLGIHDLDKMRLGHDQLLHILRFMCDVVRRTNLDLKQNAFVKKAILRAVEKGQVEFVKEMCKANPRFTLVKMDERGRLTFHYTVECGQEKVFNLIYGLIEYDRNAILTRGDDFNNIILHVAWSLSTHLNRIQGAALQMRRELQWFKVKFSHFIT
ncbi:PREDICTED: uncharacterized protein LOC103329713 [Prunus mume]|uniref:Uncharacterized protein LOC103329713 n=1 Tax=Prunus mume TaxID=102107 RepID=A0ABM0NVF9_PRUMU|nr:PREDICTED: uncharacterized protein LOC103329713 [Prunus mume]